MSELTVTSNPHRSHAQLTYLHGNPDMAPHMQSGVSPDTNSKHYLFQIKIFRGAKSEILKIEQDLNDQELLKKLAQSYDRLRLPWRKYLSLKSI